MRGGESGKIFYGWWIVVAAFLNFFFVIGIIFYGFPVFYTSFVEELGFTHAQVTQGFFLGFLIVGLPFGLVAGAVIDRVGAKWVILTGVALVGTSLLLMARMTKLWQYEALCVLEVLGYVFAGPIATQVLVARWFRARRGRAMGIAYLGLGSGGVVAPMLINYADKDDRINAGIPAFEEALKANKVKYQLFKYDGTQHGFNNDTTPRYDKAAATQAWKRTMDFFKKNLKG